VIDAEIEGCRELWAETLHGSQPGAIVTYGQKKSGA
jgi:hypothetical protein